MNELNQQNRQQTNQPSGKPINGYKVLVIEDNPEMLALTKWILKDDGNRVFTAINAAETLNILDTPCPENKTCYDKTCISHNCYDAVIIDYDLPDVTGGTLGAWIRSKFPDIAIIIITGYGKLPSIVRQTFNIKATLLTKPLVPEELLAALEVTIERRRLARDFNSEESIPEGEVSTKSLRHILQLATNTQDLLH